jgi:hypothetical protein
MWRPCWDRLGGLLGVQEFPATAAVYAGLLGWLAGFETVTLAGMEGTGSYRGNRQVRRWLARHMAAGGTARSWSRRTRAPIATRLRAAGRAGCASSQRAR